MSVSSPSLPSFVNATSAAVLSATRHPLSRQNATVSPVRSFCAPLGHHRHPLAPRYLTARPDTCKSSSSYFTVVSEIAPTQPPNYDDGFDPSTDEAYDEVHPFSITPVRDACALLTLRPAVSAPASRDRFHTNTNGDIAFKMSVTLAQIDALRRALASRRRGRSSGSVASLFVWDEQPQQPQEPQRQQKQKQKQKPRLSRVRAGARDRPGTHDLLKSMIDACGAVITQAAITHMADDVFVARIWLRTEQGVQHMDCRPSDATVLCLRACAPVFLHRGLLARWGVPVAAVRRDAAAGRCELLACGVDVRSARSLLRELGDRPVVFRLAVLKMRLDVAVRAQRFREARRVEEEIGRICPIDRLQKELRIAVEEERFLDARDLQDTITIWRARVRMWERGEIDLEAGGSNDV